MKTAMKKTQMGDMKRPVSEGKIIEVIPVIFDPMGSQMMLPPALWHIENWVIGFIDEHILPSPMQFWSNQRQRIPGSNANTESSMTFLVRILEDGESPNGVPVGSIDAEAVKQLIAAVRIAPQVYS